MSLANHFYSASLSIYIYVQSHYLHVIRINRHYQSICLFVTETNYSNRGVKNFKNLTTFLFDRWLSKYTSRSKLTGKTANRNMQFAGTTLTKYIFYIYMHHTHLWSWFFFFITGSFSLRYNFQRIDLWTEQSLSSHALLKRKTRWNVLISYPTDIYVLSHLHHADACRNWTKIIFASVLHYSVFLNKSLLSLSHCWWACTKQKLIYRLI